MEYTQLSQLLDALENAMVQQGLWLELNDPKTPTAEDLASTQPFCIDTMDFEVWLQFVLVARFRFMIEEQLPLPASCGIYPMALESFKEVSAPEVLESIKAIDDLFESGFTGATGK